MHCIGWEVPGWHRAQALLCGLRPPSPSVLQYPPLLLLLLARVTWQGAPALASVVCKEALPGPCSLAADEADLGQLC